MKSASPSPTPTPISAAALWLGSPVTRADASIAAGVLWLIALVGALWIGPEVFGLLVTTIAAIGAWQAATVHSQISTEYRGHGRSTSWGGIASDPGYRLPAAALAGAVGLAAIIDTRLAGAVLAAAVVASFLVVGALGSSRMRAATGRRQLAQAPAPPAALLARAGLLIRCWMQVALAAAGTAAVARHSVGAALVLVGAAACYDAGVYVTAAERPPGLRGPLVGVIAAVSAVFALTGLSVPPFAPSDVVRFGAIAALTLPLGPAVGRSITVWRPRSRSHRSHASDSAAPAPTTASTPRPGTLLERVRARAQAEWAVRRIDSLSVTALAWMWGLGLLTL